jgi:hypothetical protein
VTIPIRTLFIDASGKTRSTTMGVAARERPNVEFKGTWTRKQFMDRVAPRWAVVLMNFQE